MGGFLVSEVTYCTYKKINFQLYKYGSVLFQIGTKLFYLIFFNTPNLLMVTHHNKGSWKKKFYKLKLYYLEVR